MNPCSVKAITATVGGPSTFVLHNDSSGYELSLTSSILVQQLLIDAFFTGGRVAIEYLPGTTVVRRVHPFEAGNGPDPSPPNKYHVARLATQRMANGRDEHLEAFLVNDRDQETAYNVYDQFLQHLLSASFAHNSRNRDVASLNIEFDGEEIATLRLGKNSVHISGN